MSLSSVSVQSRKVAGRTNKNQSSNPAATSQLEEDRILDSLQLLQPFQWNTEDQGLNVIVCVKRFKTDASRRPSHGGA
jgi:hypothetical protein